MDRAVAGCVTGLLSVSGLRRMPWRRRADSRGLELAIRIAPDHGILAGDDAALLATERQLAERGASCKRLTVPIASHSSWMRPAAAAFAVSACTGCLRQVEMSPLRSTQAAAQHYASDALRAALIRQMRARFNGPHAWMSWPNMRLRVSSRSVAEEPCRACGRLAILRIPVRAIEDFRRPDGMAAWVERVCRR